MNDQLILKFPSYNAYKKEDFYVSPSNQSAYDFINSWPKWIKRIANIYGPTGSGKSHLASILKSKTTCLIVNGNELNEQIFLKYKTKEALIIENFDETISENFLFTLWNSALQDNKYLLINSIKPITSYKFQLKDLVSRINSSLIIGINLPEDDLISVILTKNFSDRQITVDKKHIDYIIKRIDRSYEKISQFILTLDKYSLKKGSPFDLKMIKEVLKMI
jgi:chromosomal replication initiation ATPase DnaA